MTNQLAGFGEQAWLPVSVRRSMVREDAREALEAKRAERERAERAEAFREQNLTLAAQQAEARGEEMTVLALARGELRGRMVSDIFAVAMVAADRDDAREAARVYRDGHGEPERLHVEVGEPVIHQARSETGRRIFNRARRFRAVLEARRQLEAAEKAAIASKDDYGYVCASPRGGAA